MTIEIDALTPFEARIEASALREKLIRWDLAYHQADAPEVDDATYDAAKLRLLAIEARFPELAAGSPTAKIGAPAAEGFGKVRHGVPMLSLDNAFSEDDVREFEGRIRRFLALPPTKSSPLSPNPRSTACPSACAMRTANSSVQPPVATAARARTSPPISVP